MSVVLKCMEDCDQEFKTLMINKLAWACPASVDFKVSKFLNTVIHIQVLVHYDS